MNQSDDMSNPKTERPDPGFLIQSSLEKYARTTPDHSALSLQGAEMSYAALDAAANQLAHALIQNGACPQDRIGIFMFKSLELAVGVYGALKAGCVFVPLDPFMPAERLQFILRDCEINHLISSEMLLNTLSELDSHATLNLYGVEGILPMQQTSWSEIRSLPANRPEVVVTDQDLGYIMYTSGSTGSPKGMMHTHVGSITYARWGAEHVNLTREDRVASHAPLHFDLSIFDFFSTAWVGGTVVLVPEAVARFPASWTKIIETERITVVFTVPYTLISMQNQGAMQQRNLSSLRWILFGGEPYPVKHLKQLMEQLPDVQFTNVYGPAEAPSCTCHDVRIEDVQIDLPLPIGTVSRNSADIIVDTNGNDCDINTAGELCIRSTSLTVGYWNRPDLNKDAYLVRPGLGFFPHIFFRTGDRVVRYSDGLLRYLGRSDRMIKTRGHRVELDEVEAALAKHDSVSEAAAYAVPAENESQMIMAAVTVHEGLVIKGNELMRFIGQKLPKYALPQSISIVEELPHTTSGKLDRRKLAETMKNQDRYRPT